VVFRALALGVLAAAVVYHLRWSQEFYRVKSVPVGRGGDAVITYVPEVSRTGAITATALRWIDEQMPPEATFVALPEGIMLNYLSRRVTTARQVNFMMTEAIAFGEGALLADLERRPPDYVLLVHKDTSEFGVGPFGADPRYGRRIMHWVYRHYRPVALFGDEPFRDARFGIKVLKRDL
jgi:hypothetical protein